MKIARLQKRQDFVRLNESGRTLVTPAFVVLSAPGTSSPPTVRIGFTASRKVGNSVIRNRARRRLRAVVDQLIRLNPQFTAPAPLDINLIARYKVLTRDYAQLEQDLRRTLEELGCTC